MLCDYFNQNINTLYADSDTKVFPPLDDLWLPTPENSSNTDYLTGIQRRFYDENFKLKSQEVFDPLNNAIDRHTFSDQFLWKNSVFDAKQKSTIDDLFFRHYYIFARHFLDIGCNDEFQVKLTPEHNNLIYTSASTPIHYPDEVLVEMALIQYSCVITTHT